MSGTLGSPQADAAPARVALFLHTLAGGGAERNLLMLARGFQERGYRVDLVLGEARGPLQSELPPDVRVVELGRLPAWRSLPVLLSLPAQTLCVGGAEFWRAKPRVVRCLGPLARYLREERPVALLTSVTKNGIVALWARWLAGVPTRVVVREASHFSHETARRSPAQARSITRLVTQWYPRAEAIVAVSEGVADDLCGATGLEREKIRVLYNPVDVDGLAAQSVEPPDDPWLSAGEPSVVLGAGRLGAQKDFGTLLSAFARARAQRECRLVILGEGPQRAQLEALAKELGVRDDVRFPGFVANPYAYMARAAVFALSSRWEGFPNVLLEALACGCPVVSTDCPSGPAELLQNGRFGRLVAVGDSHALASALLEALEKPPSAEDQKSRAREFSPAGCIDRYLEVLIGGGAMVAPHHALSAREEAAPRTRTAPGGARDGATRRDR